jgi:pilus assembly protein Flp/PilA
MMQLTICYNIDYKFFKHGGMNLGCYVRQLNLDTQKTKLEESKMERIKNFFNDESGAAAVEYGLLVAVIALVMVVGATTLGTGISGLFSDASGKLGAVAP